MRLRLVHDDVVEVPDEVGAALLASHRDVEHTLEQPVFMDEWTYHISLPYRWTEEDSCSVGGHLWQSSDKLVGPNGPLDVCVRCKERRYSPSV